MTRLSIKSKPRRATSKPSSGAAQPAVTGDAVTGRRRGRPAGLALDRSDLILSAALRVFASQGYASTGLKEIARATGITRPAIYHYYRSKSQLLFEAVTHALGQLIARLRQLDPAAFASHGQHLEALVRAQAIFEVESSGVTPFIDSVLYGPMSKTAELTGAQRQELRRMQRELVDIYRTVLRRGAASGELDVRSSTVTAFSILGMVSHLAVWFRSGGQLSSTDVAALMAQLARRLTRREPS
jgi:AcrR family transcriptional regulator